MEVEASKGNPLGTEKIGTLLRKYAIPSIISLIINSLYNIVDQIFIGHGVGYLGNGATNIVAPIATIAIALSALFGDGLAAIYSLSLGRQEKKQAAQSVGNMVVMASVVGVLFGAVALAFIQPLCLLFGATENILPYAVRYGSIIAMGFPAVILGTAINSVIRADGSPRYAMFSMMIGAVLNTILDPIFIMGFHWSIEGAAIATILSQYVGLAFNIVYLFRFKNIKLSKGCWIPRWAISYKILSLGVASCFNNLAATLIAAISNNPLASYGAQSPYGDRVLPLDDVVWNYDARNYSSYLMRSLGEADLSWVMEHTAVLHFCGKEKPWKPYYRHRFGVLYLHYREVARRLFSESEVP